MNISPETHRYVGMWRPPFETIWPPQAGFILCNCGRPMNFYNSYQGAANDVEIAIDHWLRGHFDVPQYELKPDASFSYDEAMGNTSMRRGL